ncbi:phage holin family protein [Nocardia vinacea]|uniref:phage holin family protein n=1 Tax=Nocardia vinacea TaxID=96468 RepID=UPI002E15549A|nr:phage holin family protein [Nocardia vinacea]
MNQSQNEFRVCGHVTKGYAIGLIVLAVVIAAWMVSPLWVPQDVLSNEIAAVVVGLLFFFWGFRKQVFRQTMIRATLEGLEFDKNVLREPWQHITSVSIGTLASVGVDSVTKQESRRSYWPILIVKRTAGGVTTTYRYETWFDQPWQELFRYIHAVAPHVQLADVREAQRDAHEANRPGRSNVYLDRSFDV